MECGIDTSYREWLAIQAANAAQKQICMQYEQCLLKICANTCHASLVAA
jgi:hypothetical protein